MGGSVPNVVDWLTLAAATAGTILGTFTTIWSVRRADTEKFALHIEWAFEPHSEEAEYPVLYIQNRSAGSIQIAEMAIYKGFLRKRRSCQTVKWWDDPTDLNFPYEVKAGETGKYALSSKTIKKQFNKIGRWRRTLSWLRRATFWIGVSTVAGKRRFIAGDSALEWSARPSWLQLNDD